MNDTGVQKCVKVGFTEVGEGSKFNSNSKEGELLGQTWQLKLLTHAGPINQQHDRSQQARLLQACEYKQHNAMLKHRAG